MIISMTHSLLLLLHMRLSSFVFAYFLGCISSLHILISSSEVRHEILHDGYEYHLFLDNFFSSISLTFLAGLFNLVQIKIATAGLLVAGKS